MNWHDSGRFRTESVESAAKRYKTLGFSTIPLHGARNPQQPKLPAIRWARFQHTHPSDEDLYMWFHNQPDAGIGIVCGRISRLAVLDFDDASVASEFRHLYPELLDTFTVRSGTRGLPHFYYRLPEGKLITTSAYPGADLRGEGAYVVAPPTHVGEVRWVVENDVPIHTISEFELRRVMRFLTGLKPVEIAPSETVNNASNAKVSEFRHPLSEDELIVYYRQICGLGRNQALFKTAIKARDVGISETLCGFMLASVHAQQLGSGDETYQTRYGEAIRTIASAYKRAPRKTVGSSTEGLGNAAREWLLANGLTTLSRVLDGLYSIGLKPNDCFSEREACQKLKPLGIGRRSIMAALRANIGEGVGIPTVDTPLYPPINANAANGSEDLNHSCEMSRGAKRVKILKRGRPARLYRLPSPSQVAEMLGIVQTASDGVTKEDFVSSGKYRQALHRQLLERRPGNYARAWLGERLGVSRWTTRRYEKAAHLHVKPTYATQNLSWSSASKLPSSADEVSYGVFLEASDGKRYPAIRGVALKLLKQGFEPVVRHQQANYYSANPIGVGIPTPQLQQIGESMKATQSHYQSNPPLQKDLSVGIPTAFTQAYLEKHPPKYESSSSPMGIPTHPSGLNHQLRDMTLSAVGIPTPMQHEPTFWFCPNCLDFHVMKERPASCRRCGCKTDWEILPSNIWHDAQTLKQWWQTRYRDQHQVKHEHSLAAIKRDETVLTPQAKVLIEKLHHQIPNLSLSNARKIVREFSEYLIEKALAIVHARKGLRSPAGFLITFLRSEYKLLNNNITKSELVPSSRGELAVEWVRRLAKSQYLSFISNADDILKLGLSHDPSPA